ncbi:non-heme iron oxygenase ferredoxin subunit [Propionibacteriaceae bacterium Y2011]|uniref:non-heme iron oxygenase ferredoxin subunit n=1 Tax=Microlunatus sp. Y2014 TaxID=3418488 RepID=UPI003B45D543
MAFVRACAVSELAPESALAVEVGEEDVAVVQSGGQFYAIRDECSHASIPLSEGDVGDAEIECYLHGSRFSLRNGAALGLPATEPVPVYPCRVSGDDIEVDVDNPLPAP